MSGVGRSLNLPQTLDHLPRSFAILPSYAVPVRRHMPGWWRGHPRRSLLSRPRRDCRLSRAHLRANLSRAHVRTNEARARTCRGGVVSASIRRIQFLKGNHRRPLWRTQSLPWRPLDARCPAHSRHSANGGSPPNLGVQGRDPQRVLYVDSGRPQCAQTWHSFTAFDRRISQQRSLLVSSTRFPGPCHAAMKAYLSPLTQSAANALLVTTRAPSCIRPASTRKAHYS